MLKLKKGDKIFIEFKQSGSQVGIYQEDTEFLGEPAIVIDMEGRTFCGRSIMQKTNINGVSIMTDGDFKRWKGVMKQDRENWYKQTEQFIYEGNIILPGNSIVDAHKGGVN